MMLLLIRLSLDCGREIDFGSAVRAVVGILETRGICTLLIDGQQDFFFLR
jgi:hypothetical protein